MRKRRGARSAWPPATVIPKRSRSARTSSRGVDSVRGQDRRDDGGAVLVGREQLEAHRLRTLPARAAERCVPGKRGLQALVEEHPERRVERDDERDGGRERSRPRRERGSQLLPVEVEARHGRSPRPLPGPRGHRRHREPRRRHQRLLRAGDDDVEPPRVRLERHCAEARDRVDDWERSRVVHRARERLDVGDDAGRRLRVDEERDLGARLLQPRPDVVRARRLAPGVPELVDVGAVRASRASPSGRRRRRRSPPARARRARGGSPRRTRTRPFRRP